MTDAADPVVAPPETEATLPDERRSAIFTPHVISEIQEKARLGRYLIRRNSARFARSRCRRWTT